MLARSRERASPAAAVAGEAQRDPRESRLPVRQGLAQVRAELSESKKKALQGEELKALSDDLQGRISELEKENQELKSVIDKISEMTKIKEETR